MLLSVSQLTSSEPCILTASSELRGSVGVYSSGLWFSSSRRYPRINKESLLPIAKNMGLSEENGEAWYPPGHGDIYTSFSNSGLLDKLLAEGKEYIFVSNIDNLGATVDLFIIHHLMSQPADKRCEFIMEVTDKTRADVKVRAARRNAGSF